MYKKYKKTSEQHTKTLLKRFLYIGWSMKIENNTKIRIQVFFLFFQFFFLFSFQVWFDCEII